MASNRGEFSSRLGFIMAAAGSAIGLGNIWGFPGQTASNGGAAFVLVYLVMTFIIAYPALMAELTIGRYSESNIVGAFSRIKGAKPFQFIGYAGLICACLILSFSKIFTIAKVSNLQYSNNAFLNFLTSSLSFMFASFPYVRIASPPF